MPAGNLLAPEMLLLRKCGSLSCLKGLTKAGGCVQVPGHQYHVATKIKEIDASIAPKSPSEERTNARKALSKPIYSFTDPLRPFLFCIANECPTSWRASSIPAAR